MKAKRGQLTVFVIIGVVLVIGLGLFLFVKSSSVPKEEAVPADVAPVKIYIEECLKQTAEDAVLNVAFNGGYYNIPENSTDFNSLGIPYYYIDGRVLVPSKTSIQNELAAYVTDNMNNCLVDFEAFTGKGYTIETGEMNVVAEIAEKNVLFTVDYPLTITKDGSQNKLSSFDSEVKANMLKMRDASAEYIDAQKEVPDATRISHIIEICTKYGLTSNILNFGDIILYSFVDNNTLIRGQPLVYTFSVYYPHELLSPQTVEITEIPEQTATVGTEFSLKINAVGENLSYDALTNLFVISNTGEITFTPAKDQVGAYSIQITVTDSDGNKGYTTLKLTIKE